MLPEYPDKKNIESRAEFFWRYGELIATREYSNYGVALFLVDDQLAEVWHRSVDYEIERVEAVKDHQVFEKYLPEINISQVTSLL